MEKSTNFGQFFELPNPSLRGYFKRVELGQPEEYRTNFYGKETPVQDILAEWDNTLKQISNQWPTLYEFESDLRAKVGPLSIMKPLQERMKDIDAYYESILLDSEPINPNAIRKVIDELQQVSGLRLRNKVHTVEQMKKSTNSGAPYFTKRRRLVPEVLDWDISKLGEASFQYLKTDPSVWYWLAAILGWRGQEGGPNDEDVKQRVVWMFPFVANICELQAYQVLIEAAQSINFVPAWVSMDAVDVQVTKLFDTKKFHDQIICTDFSKFDQHYNHVMQSASLDILNGVFSTNVTWDDWVKTIYPIKYNIPLAYDWGKIRFGAHGMGSGSGGTNADETLGHRALQHEAAMDHGEELNPASMCLGDDGCLTYPGISSEQVLESYTKHGLEMNPDKQSASNLDCTYLRRWHHTDYRMKGVCVGVYSTFRALGRLCEQERYYNPKEWNAKMVALRQLSILENVKYHPLREKFAEFCMRGDKYRLGIDIPGFLDNIEAEAKKAIDFMPDFLGYTRTLPYGNQPTQVAAGIRQWWIVQYLLDKRSA